MDIPDINDFKRLEKKISSMEFALSTMIDIVGEPVLFPKDIAIREGVSKAQLHREPWRSPHFGQSDFATGRKRWRLKTYLQWRDRDESARKREWDLMRLSDRQRIVMGQFNNQGLVV